MTLNRTALLLAAMTAAALTTAAQTPAKTTTAKKPVRTTHAGRTTATTSAKPVVAIPAANAEDTPPNVPAVVGAPKPLYTLRYVDTVIGTGELSQPHKFYTVHYTGWLIDGTKFDSSVDRGTPITFPYGAHQVIPGWDTGFEGMHVGGKRRLYIPYQLAYGETGRPPVIPAKANLIFDIEFVGQSDTPPASPAAPAAPKPADTPGKPEDPTKPTVDPAKPANP